MAELRYGENPHQAASWEPNPLVEWVQHQGKLPSYTNLLDINAAVQIALEFDVPAAVVIKHTNPCGVAIGHSAVGAYVRARDTDAKSAYGSIVGLNRPLDVQTASEIASTFVECVIAPSIDSDALKIMSAKENIRVITANYPKLQDVGRLEWDSQRLLIGTLSQQRDRVTEARTPWPNGDYPLVVTKRHPTVVEWAALRFAWRICAHVKSNTVIYTTEDRTLGIGGGQPNRDNSAKIGRGFLDIEYKRGAFVGPAPMRPDSVAASDAFFPFRDGLDQVANAGATAVVQPGGSNRDQEVIAAADEHGIAMVFTGKRHFRH